MLEYIKQLEEDNRQLRAKLEERNCPQYAKQLCVRHSVASYFNNRHGDEEKTILEKMSSQLANEIMKPEYSNVDVIKEAYTGNMLYQMKVFIVPT